MNEEGGLEEAMKEQDLKAKWELNRYINKQRTLVFCSRGVTHRDRHLLSDIRDLLPHSKTDVKFDTKDNLMMVNEVCELKNCNNCVFFEARKKKDLYMWLSRTPHGPSAKFLVQNIHTMSEVKMTGNCLKGSRPLLVFDKAFDDEASPHWGLLKELFLQIFGSPKGHPKVKPFVDHILSFFILDGRVWFRNYQIVYEGIPDTVEVGVSDDQKKKKEQKNKGEPILVEIGPRFVLNPVRIFSSSFGGSTLWENASYVSPNTVRRDMKKGGGGKYLDKQQQKKARKDHLEKHKLPADPLADVFA